MAAARDGTETCGVESGWKTPPPAVFHGRSGPILPSVASVEGLRERGGEIRPPYLVGPRDKDDEHAELRDASFSDAT